jgi:hypothetical protein
VTALCGEQERALIKHPHIDPSRVVLVGRSFGGLIAPRGASGEHRLAAMIADPGQLEMGNAVMNRLGDLGQHLDDPAADARFEALLTIPALRTFLAPRMATHGLTSVRGYFRDLTAALDGIRTIFIAMGSTGTEVSCSRSRSAAAGISSIQQVTRLSVLNASADSLLITREWAILADENDYTTGTFGQITGRPARPVAEFFHQYRAVFT